MLDPETMTYTSHITALLVVPNELSEALDAKLDREISKHPGAAPDREYLRNNLLAFVDEFGYIPDFSLAKVKS